VAVELRTYLDELWRRLPAFARNAAGLPPDAPGSPEWLEAAGRYWWHAREESGVSREDAARVLGCTEDQLRLMEFGIIAPSTFARRRLHAYGTRLGYPDLYDRYHAHFER
jgi:hypothetical protein